MRSARSFGVSSLLMGRGCGRSASPALGGDPELARLDTRFGLFYQSGTAAAVDLDAEIQVLLRLAPGATGGIGLSVVLGTGVAAQDLPWALSRRGGRYGQAKGAAHGAGARGHALQLEHRCVVPDAGPAQRRSACSNSCKATTTRPARACLENPAHLAAGLVDCLAGRAQVERLQDHGPVLASNPQRRASIEAAPAPASASGQ